MEITHELRERVALVVATALCTLYQVPVVVQAKDYWVADAMIQELQNAYNLGKMSVSTEARQEESQ